ncbi:MAG: glycosyltransferase, partial [Isosphaeraceae bacterium]
PGGASDVPDDGFPWQATRQPIVLDAWPVTPGPAGGKYTTVMNWSSYPPREYGDRRFGMKNESFSPYTGLPRRTTGPFELALGGGAAPRETLRAAGWSIADPLVATRDPWSYQDYIRRSRGEFAIAKHGYVVSRSAWFSERSACYLASGRPVIVQDTGFSHDLPTGNGVLAFENPDDAIAAVEEVNRRYDHHCRAARDLAIAYFDSRAVLTRLIESASRISVNRRAEDRPRLPTTPTRPSD